MYVVHVCLSWLGIDYDITWKLDKRYCQHFNYYVIFIRAMYTMYAVCTFIRTIHVSVTSAHLCVRWLCPQLLGSSAIHCSVNISPLSGSIGPRETVPLTLTTTWNSLVMASSNTVHTDFTTCFQELSASCQGWAAVVVVSYSWYNMFCGLFSGFPFSSIL